MFNVGPLELLVILIVALVVVGPEKLPELARTIGRTMRELRKIQDDLRDTIRFDVDDKPEPTPHQVRPIFDEPEHAPVEETPDLPTGTSPDEPSTDPDAADSLPQPDIDRPSAPPAAEPEGVDESERTDIASDDDPQVDHVSGPDGENG